MTVSAGRLRKNLSWESKRQLKNPGNPLILINHGSKRWYRLKANRKLQHFLYNKIPAFAGMTLYRKDWSCSPIVAPAT